MVCFQSQGVDILIALGHAGYEENDQDMAYQIEEIDLVVGGHSHTFLYPEGEQLPSIDIPKGPYPTYILQPGGRTVPVVQAYCYTKYMGVLTLKFDDNGELLEPVAGTGVETAEVILLDSNIPMNEMVNETMDKYRFVKTHLFAVENVYLYIL